MLWKASFLKNRIGFVFTKPILLSTLPMTVTPVYDKENTQEPIRDSSLWLYPHSPNEK